jgi:hypothetical protein
VQRTIRNKGWFIGRDKRRHEFKPGNKPWNKGIVGLHTSPGTEFKEGNVPWQKGLKGIHALDSSPVWKGGIRITRNRGLMITVAPNKSVERARLVVELRSGKKIPKGMVVYHLDGNRFNDDYKNLVVITRGEMIQRNHERGENEKATNKAYKREQILRRKQIGAWKVLRNRHVHQNLYL